MKHESVETTAASAFAYHTVPFQYLHHINREQISAHLLDIPTQFIRQRLLDSAGTTIGGQSGWNTLRKLLDEVERRMAELITPHSPVYWLHLYRRVGVMLHPKHGNKTDSMTVALVRANLECAFSKYGSLTAAGELSSAGELSVEEVLGGIYAEAWRAVDREQRGLLDAEFAALKDTRQIVATHFSREIFYSLYELEGLAYEYWRLTAKLREIGKGGVYLVSANGALEGLFNPDLDRLITSYDARIDKGGMLSTFEGQIVSEPNQSTEGHTLICALNTRREPSPILDAFNVQIADGGALNYLVGAIDIAAFYRAHIYAESPYAEKRKYSLGSILRYLYCLHFRYVAMNLHGSEERGGLNLQYVIYLHQRAYQLVSGNRTSLRSEVLSVSKAVSETIGLGTHDTLSREIEKIERDVFLSEQNRSLIGLWSWGPRYPLIPCGGGFLFDVSALPYVLRGLFFGLSTANRKGEAFEDQFRSALSSAGVHLVPNKIFRASDGSYREIDALVVKHNVGYLFECRAMFRPFVFELTEIGSQKKRNAEMEKKLQQAESARNFLEQNPKGKNYDLRGLDRIEHYVVSPFVEWVWSSEEKYWATQSMPRIISADEALDMLTGED